MLLPKMSGVMRMYEKLNSLKKRLQQMKQNRTTRQNGQTFLPLSDTVSTADLSKVNGMAAVVGNISVDEVLISVLNKCNTLINN